MWYKPSLCSGIQSLTTEVAHHKQHLCLLQLLLNLLWKFCSCDLPKTPCLWEKSFSSKWGRKTQIDSYKYSNEKSELVVLRWWAQVSLPGSSVSFLQFCVADSVLGLHRRVLQLPSGCHYTVNAKPEELSKKSTKSLVEFPWLTWPRWQVLVT